MHTHTDSKEAAGLSFAFITPHSFSITHSTHNHHHHHHHTHTHTHTQPSRRVCVARRSRWGGGVGEGEVGEREKGRREVGEQGKSKERAKGGEGECEQRERRLTPPARPPPWCGGAQRWDRMGSPRDWRTYEKMFCDYTQSYSFYLFILVVE